MTDQAAIDGMLERIERDLPPLGGVIHSVGVLSDGALTNQSWERFERVLWPKVLGAWHLHRATEGRDLDLFCLFSSRVGVMGNPGQANHAAANAFLDQLAAHRRRSVYPARPSPGARGRRSGKPPSNETASSGAERRSEDVGSPRSKESGLSRGWCVRTTPGRW